MRLKELLSEIKEVEIGGKKQLTSDFLEFLLKEDRQFFIVESVSFVGENTLTPILILRGEKYVHGGLMSVKTEIIYDKNKINRYINKYLIKYGEKS
jgi:hypothetical protein